MASSEEKEEQRVPTVCVCWVSGTRILFAVLCTRNMLLSIGNGNVMGDCKSTEPVDARCVYVKSTYLASASKRGIKARILSCLVSRFGRSEPSDWRAIKLSRWQAGGDQATAKPCVLGKPAYLTYRDPDGE